MADARTKYLALYSALNGFSDFTSINVLTSADGKDDSGEAAIAGEGKKFSELIASQGEGQGTFTDGKISLTAGQNIPKGRVVFDGVATIAQKTHEKTTPYDMSGHGQNDAFRFEKTGSYRGVQGTYYCTGADDCTTKINAGDTLTLTGTWEFKADNKDQRVTATDTVKYGWWTDTPSSASLQAGLFSSRNMMTTTAYNGGGGATYKGDALGQYALDEDNFGAFTAMATLTAKFGATDTLEGMIHDFKDADDENLTGWKVKLHKSPISSSGATEKISDDANSLQARWHIGDDKGSAGEWQAGLYGADDTGTDTAPTHVAGEFFAHGQTSERIIGAFAATPE